MALPDTMLALVLTMDGRSDEALGQDMADMGRFVALERIPVPQPGDGQALVRVSRAAVNPSDAAYIKGRYGLPRRKGVPAGFEGTGTVVAGDTPLVGRRVSFFGSGSGTWADYALAQAATLVPLRDDLRDEDAAGLIVNPVTAAAMFEIARADGAKSFVATAAGSQLGKFLIGLGRDHGCPCIAVVRREGLVDPLTRMGAAAVLVSEAPDFAARMRAAMAEHQPAVMLDAVGGPVSADLFFAMPEGARWISYGRLSPEPPCLTEMAQLIFRRKRIEGFWLSDWFRDTPPDVAERVVAEVQARFADGRWRTDISETVPLADALTRLPDAYAAKDSKVLIAP